MPLQRQAIAAPQAAAAVLIVKCYGGQVTRELQQWGCEVAAKTAPQPKPVEETANP